MSTVQTVSSALQDAMNPAAAKAKSDNDISQDRFMKLLVTQMRNQDPLNPLDNAQVTSQMAQLSTVTGIDKLNSTLESLRSSFHSSQSFQAAGMIGRAVLVPGSEARLADGKALLGVELNQPADRLQVNIHDATGRIVRSMELGAQDAGVFPLGWDGVTDDGNAAPDGLYTFALKAARGNAEIPVTPLAFGEVGSVSTGGQGVRLNLTNAGAVDFSEVRQIL
jgi:flagellar basal-body rod modification protein FlgD